MLGPRQLDMGNSGLALLALAQLRTEGYRLLNKGQTLIREHGVPGFGKQREAWEKKVLKELRKRNPVEAELWRAIGRYTPKTFLTNIDSPELQKELNLFTVDLERLTDTIDKLRQ